MATYITDGKKENHTEIKSIKVRPALSSTENCSPSKPENLISIKKEEREGKIRQKKERRMLMREILPTFPPTTIEISEAPRGRSFLRKAQQNGR